MHYYDIILNSKVTTPKGEMPMWEYLENSKVTPSYFLHLEPDPIYNALIKHGYVNVGYPVSEEEYVDMNDLIASCISYLGSGLFNVLHNNSQDCYENYCVNPYCLEDTD